MKYESFEKFANDFAKRFPKIAESSAISALEDASDFLLERIPEYPVEILSLPNPDGVSWLRTDKQRRWFFAAVKQGEVAGWDWIDGHPKKVGGGRTGNLGRSQSRDVFVNDDSVLAVLGFDSQIAPYAPWVVGPDFPGEEIENGVKYQARIHVDRWWQFADVINDNIENAWKVFGETFWNKFNEHLDKG